MEKYWFEKKKCFSSKVDAKADKFEREGLSEKHLTLVRNVLNPQSKNIGLRKKNIFSSKVDAKADEIERNGLREKHLTFM